GLTRLFLPSLEMTMRSSSPGTSGWSFASSGGKRNEWCEVVDRVPNSPYGIRLHQPEAFARVSLTPRVGVAELRMAIYFAGGRGWPQSVVVQVARPTNAAGRRPRCLCQLCRFRRQATDGPCSHRDVL